MIERSWREPDTFAVLYDRHAAPIFRFAARRLGDQAAEDVVAETFLAAFRRRDRYDVDRADARPWRCGIATNLVGNHRRSELRMLRAFARTGTDPVAEDDRDQIEDRFSTRLIHYGVGEGVTANASWIRFDGAGTAYRLKGGSWSSPSPTRARSRARGRPRSPHPTRAQLEFEFLTGLLWNAAEASPARADAAAIRALSRIPGLTAERGIADAAGRPAIGLSDTGDEQQLLLDPRTYQVTGLRTVSNGTWPVNVMKRGGPTWPQGKVLFSLAWAQIDPVRRPGRC